MVQRAQESPDSQYLQGGCCNLEAVPDRFDSLPHRHLNERFGVLVYRSCIFFLLDQGRIQEGHPGAVKLAYIKPALYNDGFRFICHQAISPLALDSG
jgi:hypothetical protein